MKAEKKKFGSIGENDIFLFTFENDNNVQFSIINYGGIITRLIVPDRDQLLTDIVLGFNNIEQYLQDHPYFGALIGRFGNRIDQGKFTLEGKTYSMVQNNGSNHLHGGIKGFDKVIWKVKSIIEEKDKIGIELEYVSPDGEENYPGTLTTTVMCSINNSNELTIEYTATTDKTTIVNLTHHGYFNLNGMKDNVLSHVMEINADKITAINDNLIPTGELIDVSNSAFDFRKPRKIGGKIAEAGGYDHNYVLNKKDEGNLSLAAKVMDESTGITMEVLTTEPGVQFYSSNYLDGSLIGKDGIRYEKHYAFCLETQHFPDSPNKPQFPTTILKPGEAYTQTTIYKFGTI
jgi:aldose 1-epimerase